MALLTIPLAASYNSETTESPRFVVQARGQGGVIDRRTKGLGGLDTLVKIDQGVTNPAALANFLAAMGSKPFLYDYLGDGSPEVFVCLDYKLEWLSFTVGNFSATFERIVRFRQ